MQTADYASLFELEEHFWWFAGMREITAALLDPVCPTGRDRMVLDAGCGTGGMIKWLARYAGSGEVIGIDLADTPLKFSAQRGERGLAQASVLQLPFADSIFDLITSFDVLPQLPEANSDELAIREMQRVLRPHGVAFVRVPAYEWMRSSHDEALATHHRYYLRELIGKMRRAGFEILRATYANSFLLPVAVWQRQVLQRIGISSPGSNVRALPPSLQSLNPILKGVLNTEAQLLKHPRARIPIGLSAICLAEKKN